MPRASGARGASGGEGGHGSRASAPGPSPGCSTSSPAASPSPRCGRSRSRTSCAASRSRPTSSRSRCSRPARRVLVTGAGGSIGSELCRQLAQLEPAQLLVLDHGENSIFDIDGRADRAVPQRRRACRSSPTSATGSGCGSVFERYRPYAVFHAAAHKHVPLMESTTSRGDHQQRARHAERRGAVRRVRGGALRPDLDRQGGAPDQRHGRHQAHRRADRPGVAEASGRNFVAVRFGNVLGSRGSVVPMFLRQIQSGGPVTVTHPEMRRYFMTIPEAVQLVLQAGAIGQGRRGVRARHGRAGQDPRPRHRPDPAVRARGRQRHRDPLHRHPAGREALRGAVLRLGERAADRHPKVLRAKNGALPTGLSTRGGPAGGRRQRNGWTDEQLRSLLGRLVPDFRVGRASSTRST